MVSQAQCLRGSFLSERTFFLLVWPALCHRLLILSTVFLKEAFCVLFSFLYIRFLWKTRLTNTMSNIIVMLVTYNSMTTSRDDPHSLNTIFTCISDNNKWISQH